MFIRSAYNYDTALASDQAALLCEDPSRAQQQFKDECDINVICQRFGITGEMPQTLQTPLQGDFTDVLDYQGALNLIRAADAGFMTLPADLRSRFQNDPGQMLDFLSDDGNRAEAEKLGLLQIVPQLNKAAPAPPAPPAG